MLWTGAPEPRMVLRRRMRSAIPAVLTQLVTVGLTAVGLALSGFGAAVPATVGLMTVFVVGFTALRHGRAIVAATRAARETRVELDEGALIIRRGEQRHERRVSSLPPLRLTMEGADVGSIGYELPRPAMPPWLATLAGAPPTDLLVESVPGAERLFTLLERQRAEARAAPRSSAEVEPRPTTADGEDRAWPGAFAQPPTGRPLADRLTRGLAWVPLWIGLPFMATGSAFMVLVIATSGTGPGSTEPALILGLAIPALFALFGGAVVLAHVRTSLTRRRLLSSGVRTMADVVATSETNVEINDEPQWVVRYRYRVGALWYGGESPMMAHDTALHWAPGDRVQVAYDPARPQESIWFGEDLVADAG